MRWNSLLEKLINRAIKKEEELKKWHRWFAWFPVKLENASTVVWLESIERKWIKAKKEDDYPPRYFFYYREINKDKND